MECTICCQEIKNLDQILKLECACNYFYHTKCIEQWFNTTLNCPLCRTIVKRENLKEAKYNPTLTVQEWVLVPPPPPLSLTPVPNISLNYNHPVSEMVYVYSQNLNILRYNHGLAGMVFLD